MKKNEAQESLVKTSLLIVSSPVQGGSSPAKGMFSRRKPLAICLFN
jgi:hypothetical protein